MKAIRRVLGVVVMIAGILGLILSLAGVVSVWVIKPTVAGYVDVTIQTLNTSIDTSQRAMEVTGDALGATVASVDALSAMLSTTAKSVEDTKPVLEQVNFLMGDTVPSVMQSASDSLATAQQAAAVLDSAIKSLNNFRTVMSAAPLIGSFVEEPDEPYDPDVPLADSLGDLSTTLSTLPETFTEMAANLDKADDNLVIIQDNLTTMSTSVALISESLTEYQTMIAQSQASMDNLRSILDNIQKNQATILNGIAIGLSFFFFWLLAAQVVIFTQGWELYQGTADRIEFSEPAKEPQSDSSEESDD